VTELLSRLGFPGGGKGPDGKSSEGSSSKLDHGGRMAGTQKNDAGSSTEDGETTGYDTPSQEMADFMGPVTSQPEQKYRPTDGNDAGGDSAFALGAQSQYRGAPQSAAHDEQSQQARCRPLHFGEIAPVRALFAKAHFGASD